MALERTGKRKMETKRGLKDRIKLVFTREEVYSLLDTIEDVNHKCIILAAFEGIKENASASLYLAKSDDLDVEKKLFRKKEGDWRPISEKLCGLMQECINLGEKDGFKETPYILKKKLESSQETYDRLAISSIFTTSKKRYGIQLSRNWLFLSGTLQEINDISVRENLTYDQVLESYRDKVYEFGTIYTSDYKDLYEAKYIAHIQSYGGEGNQDTETIDFNKMCKIALAFSGNDSIYEVYRIKEGYVFVFNDKGDENTDKNNVIVNEEYGREYYVEPDEPAKIIYKILVPDEFKRNED